jgi:hypothetical protein
MQLTKKVFTLYHAGSFISLGFASVAYVVVVESCENPGETKNHF